MNPLAVLIQFILATSLVVPALAAAPKKLGPCNLAGERKVWLQDQAPADEDEFDFSDPLPRIGAQTPATLTKSCGIRSNLFDTIDSGVVLVRLPGGGSRAFVPLHLSDKTGGFYCGAIRPKIACVTEAKSLDDGAVELTLRALPSGPASETKIKVDKSGAVSNREMSPYFVLLPVQRKIVNTFRDLREIVLEAAKDQDCARKSARDCRADRHYAAERRMMEFVRIERRVRLPVADRTADVTAFLQKYQSRGGHQGLAHRAIVINEIGVDANPAKAYASPYEVLDAVLMKSGPSFGAHQIDVGSNETDEREPFRQALARMAARADADAHLKAVAAARGFERPGREYDTLTLVAFHKSMSGLTTELRTTPGRGAVDTTYDAYLNRAAGCFAMLKGRGEPFVSSRFAMLYVVDVANQSGASVGVTLAKLALAKAAEGYEIAATETAMVEYIMSLKPGAPERADVARRVTLLRKVVQDWGTRSLEGGSTTNCDIKV